jgi:tetratricopeptide (TPR) repeat protein
MQARFDLAASYANLGDAFRVLNQHAEAAASERSAINIFEEALKKDPVPSQPRMNLGVSYQALGQILFAQGNIRAALESDQKSLSILEAEPIRRGSAKYLTAGYKDIGDVYSAMRNWKAAKDSYEKSLAEWRELEHRKELSEEDKSSLNDVVQKLKKCNRRMRNGRS